MVNPAFFASRHRRSSYHQRGISSGSAFSLSDYMKKAVGFLNNVFIGIFLGIFYIFAIGISFVLRAVLMRRRKSGIDSYWQTYQSDGAQSLDYFESPY